MRDLVEMRLRGCLVSFTSPTVADGCAPRSRDPQHRSQTISCILIDILYRVRIFTGKRERDRERERIRSRNAKDVPPSALFRFGTDSAVVQVD